MRHTLVLVLAVMVASACSSSQPSTFTLTSASTDATYWCPGHANNAPYDVHASISVHNGNSSAVAITGVTAQMTLEHIGGTWLEKVGDAYDAGAASFTPATVKPGSGTTLKIKFKSACTSPAYGTGASSYGDYKVTLRVTTSAGSYSIASANLHRILAA